MSKNPKFPADDVFHVHAVDDVDCEVISSLGNAVFDAFKFIKVTHTPPHLI